MKTLLTSLAALSLYGQSHAQTPTQLPTETLAEQLGVEQKPYIPPVRPRPAAQQSGATRSLNQRSAMSSAQARSLPPSTPNTHVNETPEISPPPPPPRPLPPPRTPNRLSEEVMRTGKLSLSFGYIHSDWKAFNSGLSQGSLAVTLSVSRYVLPHLELGLEFQSLEGLSKNGNDDKLNAAFLKPFVHISFASENSFNPWVGAALGVGQFQAWSITNDSPTNRSYAKHASGNAYAAEARLGLEAKISSKFSADLIASYLAVFDNPNHNIGGLGGHLALGFIY